MEGVSSAEQLIPPPNFSLAHRRCMLLVPKTSSSRYIYSIDYGPLDCLFLTAVSKISWNNFVCWLIKAGSNAFIWYTTSSTYPSNCVSRACVSITILRYFTIPFVKPLSTSAHNRCALETTYLLLASETRDPWIHFVLLARSARLFKKYILYQWGCIITWSGTWYEFCLGF